MAFGNNIVLTGFMGTGKTSAGRIVAQRLGRQFVDLDEEIAKREHATVAEIFEHRGEATFRARERRVWAEVQARQNLIIATGGGTLVDPENRHHLRDAVVVCLEASPGEIARRLEGDRGRPLLAGDQPTARIQQLLDERAATYADFVFHVQTDLLTVEQVADQILLIVGPAMMTSPEQ